jgi:hypothetical protein
MLFLYLSQLQILPGTRWCSSRPGVTRFQRNEVGLLPSERRKVAHASWDVHGIYICILHNIILYIYIYICIYYIYICVYIYMGHGQYLVYSSKSSIFEERIIVLQVLVYKHMLSFFEECLSSFSKPQLNFHFFFRYLEYYSPLT